MKVAKQAKQQETRKQKMKDTYVNIIVITRKNFKIFGRVHRKNSYLSDEVEYGDIQKESCIRGLGITYTESFGMQWLTLTVMHGTRGE